MIKREGCRAEREEMMEAERRGRYRGEWWWESQRVPRRGVEIGEEGYSGIKIGSGGAKGGKRWRLQG